MQISRSVPAPGGFLPLCSVPLFLYAVRMHLAIAVFLTLVWVACNFYLWSLKQDQVILLLESLGMSAIAFPALYWYMTNQTK
jgi:hypothetical protein